MSNNEGDLKVWYIPQVPMKPFEVVMPTQDLAAAGLVHEALIGLSMFEFENKIKPDYSDMSGIARYEDGEWCDVEDDEWVDLLPLDGTTFPPAPDATH